MTRKRRMFEIDLPDDLETKSVGATDRPTSASRGPMASAISENAEAVKARKSAAEAIREENDALAHEFVALQEAGHVVKFLPLAKVQSTVLIRDRMPGEDVELAELVTSIRDLGLSNPIRVMEWPDGNGYELVQGFRRLSAYRALWDETQDDRWAKIPALVMPSDTDVSGLYRRMVDENVIRKDLSFAEMAFAARNYAIDPKTPAETVTDAVAALFESAPYSKRNYIRSFAALLEAVGDDLRFPTAIPRRLGVALARVFKEDPSKIAEVKAAMAATPVRDEALELAMLADFAKLDTAPEAPAKPKKRAGGSKTKTTFHIRSAVGQVKCTAGQGRLEIKADRDFSSIERARLEQAIADLIDGLG